MAGSALDATWQTWLDENLQRGCSPVQLFKVMRENGFDVGSIRRMMGDAYPEGAEYQDAPDGDLETYLALAGTMEVHGKAAGAQRFESNLLQLYTIANFLTAEECERVMALAETKLQPSQVTHSNGDPTFRTSYTCYLHELDDPLVRYVDEKIARTIGIRLAYAEPIQAQRYMVGQEFKAHHDYFGADTNIYGQFYGNAGQRTWTFMVYLNDTPKGGGTYFPYLNHTFYPKQGMAVVWNNLFPDGSVNRYSLHHGMPVEEGRKFVITKWFRAKGSGEMFYDESELDLGLESIKT